MNEHSNEFHEIIRKADLLWIATTPQNQIQVLQKLQSKETRVILEKPIATTPSDFIALKPLLKNSACKVYLSQPWTFSSLWGEAKNILLSLQGDLKIEAIRGGDLSRVGFPPEIDWAPHDLYLLADYLKSSGNEDGNSHSVSRQLVGRNIVLKYDFGADLVFEMTAGYRETRQAQWRVFLDGRLVLTLDFETLQLINHRSADLKKFVAHTSSPLESMLNAALQEEPNVDWQLVFKLYEDLVGSE